MCLWCCDSLFAAHFYLFILLYGLVSAGMDIIRHVRGLRIEEQTVAWQIVEKFEAAGRVDSQLQTEAVEVLSALRNSRKIQKMAIVTRNNDAAVDQYVSLFIGTNVTPWLC